MESPAELLYREEAPAADLVDWVQCHWEFAAGEGAEARPHHVLPDGCVSIVCVQARRLVWRIGSAVRYTINVDDAGTWHETGEYTRDQGRTWQQFIEMKLTRRP